MLNIISYLNACPDISYPEIADTLNTEGPNKPPTSDHRSNDRLSWPKFGDTNELLRKTNCSTVVHNLAIALLGIHSSAGECYTMPSPDSGEVRIFAQSVCGGVDNNPLNPTFFTIDTPSTITKIGTYHWNHGSGSTPGKIGVEVQDGTIYGPWQASGQRGQGGALDAYWIAAIPNGIDLPAGTYRVLDSDPSTWAYNSESGNSGVVSVIGRSASGTNQEGANVGATRSGTWSATRSYTGSNEGFYIIRGLAGLLLFSIFFASVL